MNRVDLKGSITALVTPMDNAGQIDYESLKSLIDWQIASGTHGLVIMGTTGESSLVSKQEHFQVVKAAIEHCDKRVPVIAGCGSVATDEVLQLIDSLNELQPDAYLCVTPYYIKPSQSGLIAHYSAVAEACAAPLILYNVPGRTACDLSNDSVVTLSKHPNIVGIKDAVGDIERAKQLFSQIPEDFYFFSGDDATAFDYMVAGGHGVISVTSNIAPRKMSQWIELICAKDNLELAKTVFNELMPLHQKLFIEANPIPVKWALVQMKRIQEGIRMPLTEPEKQSQMAIFEALQSASIDL